MTENQKTPMYGFDENYENLCDRTIEESPNELKNKNGAFDETDRYKIGSRHHQKRNLDKHAFDGAIQYTEEDQILNSDLVVKEEQDSILAELKIQKKQPDHLATVEKYYNIRSGQVQIMDRAAKKLEIGLSYQNNDSTNEQDTVPDEVMQEINEDGLKAMKLKENTKENEIKQNQSSFQPKNMTKIMAKRGQKQQQIDQNDLSPILVPKKNSIALKILKKESGSSTYSGQRAPVFEINNNMQTLQFQNSGDSSDPFEPVNKYKPRTVIIGENSEITNDLVKKQQQLMDQEFQAQIKQKIHLQRLDNQQNKFIMKNQNWNQHQNQIQTQNEPEQNEMAHENENYQKFQGQQEPQIFAQNNTVRNNSAMKFQHIAKGQAMLQQQIINPKFQQSQFIRNQNTDTQQLPNMNGPAPGNQENSTFEIGQNRAQNLVNNLQMQQRYIENRENQKLINQNNLVQKNLQFTEEISKQNILNEIDQEVIEVNQKSNIKQMGRQGRFDEIPQNRENEFRVKKFSASVKPKMNQKLQSLEMMAPPVINVINAGKNENPQVSPDKKLKFGKQDSQIIGMMQQNQLNQIGHGNEARPRTGRGGSQRPMSQRGGENDGKKQISNARRRILQSKDRDAELNISQNMENLKKSKFQPENQKFDNGIEKVTVSNFEEKENINHKKMIKIKLNSEQINFAKKDEAKTEKVVIQGKKPMKIKMGMINFNKSQQKNMSAISVIDYKSDELNQPKQ